MTTRERLEAKTAEQLRRQARDAGLTGVGRLRKAELVELLLASEPPSAPVEVAESRDGGSGRLLGSLISFGGGLGLAVSLVLLVLGPLLLIRLGGWAELQLHSMAESARSLAATSRSSRSALSAGADSLHSAREALLTVEDSLQNVDPLLTSVRSLLGDDLPTTIDATETALLSAQQGAAAMDRVLRGLRLFGLDYNPELPLDQSLAATAQGLAPLPASLQAVEASLVTSQQDLTGVRTDLTAVAADLDDLAQEMDRTADSLSGYAGQLDLAAGAMDRLSERTRLVGWLLAILAVLASGWLAALNWVMVVNGRRMRDGLPVGTN